MKVILILAAVACAQIVVLSPARAVVSSTLQKDDAANRAGQEPIAPNNTGNSEQNAASYSPSPDRARRIEEDLKNGNRDNADPNTGAVGGDGSANQGQN